MSSDFDFISCSTYHDPEFALKEDLIKAIPIMKDLFRNSTICLTPASHETIKAFLEQENFIVNYGPPKRRLETYKGAIKLGIQLITNKEKCRLFYVDFDRLIHWINNHVEELYSMKNAIKEFDYVHVGRTKRAFGTHPSTQVKTERVVNELCSKAMGLEETIDVISVCFTFTKELGKKLLNHEMITDMGFYGAWPVLFWNWTDPAKRTYIEHEGLEWETPDRFMNQINQMGMKQWLEAFKSPDEWELRVELMHQSLTELMNNTSLIYKD